MNTAAIILAIGGWTAFAGMTAVAGVLGRILRDREQQAAHLKASLRKAHADNDALWEKAR